MLQDRSFTQDFFCNIQGSQSMNHDFDFYRLDLVIRVNNNSIFLLDNTPGPIVTYENFVTERIPK